VYCAGDQLLARARFAEDQHRHVGSRHQFDTFHDRAQAGIVAHDRVGEFLASQAPEQRLLVGLGGLAQGGHFAELAVVVEGHRERIQEHAHQRQVAVAKCLSAGGRQNQQPHAATAQTQGAGQHVAGCRVRRMTSHRTADNAPSRGAPLPLAAPRQERFHLRCRAFVAGVAERLALRGQADGNGLDARSLGIDLPDENLAERRVGIEHGRNGGRGLADVDMATRLAPDIKLDCVEVVHGFLVCYRMRIF